MDCFTYLRRSTLHEAALSIHLLWKTSGNEWKEMEREGKGMERKWRRAETTRLSIPKYYSIIS
jgi:hypothetical protein